MKNRPHIFNPRKFKYSSSARFIFICLILLSFSGLHSQGKVYHSVTPAPYPFFVYNFGGLEKYTPEEQVDLVKSIGYDGMVVYAITASDLQDVSRYIACSEQKKNFKIYAVFVRYNFNDPEPDRNRWKDVVKMIAGKGINLWFIFGEKTKDINDDKVMNILKDVVKESGSHKVQVTLYPHSLLYISSAEQALPFVEKIHNPNLKLAVHLCHEIRAGNGNRIGEVVNKVKKYIGYVTIAGTDVKPDLTSLYRMDTSTIKPLDRGNFDVRIFLKALRLASYSGPVGFINFKINEEPQDYLLRSLNAWHKMKAEVSKKEHR